MVLPSFAYTHIFCVVCVCFGFQNIFTLFRGRDREMILAYAVDEQFRLE